MSRDGCPEEDTQQKKESLGIVINDEPIVYALVHPTSINDQSVAYFHSGRLKNRQLSVCRASYSSYREMYEKVVQPQLEADSTRQYRGYLWAPCHEIRSILATRRNDAKAGSEEQRPVGAFCVIDDGDANFRAHARLGYSAPSLNFWSKNDREAARGNLSLTLHTRGIHNGTSTPPFPHRKFRKRDRETLAPHAIRRMQRALRRAARRRQRIAS